MALAASKNSRSVSKGSVDAVQSERSDGKRRGPPLGTQANAHPVARCQIILWSSAAQPALRPLHATMSTSRSLPVPRWRSIADLWSA